MASNEGAADASQGFLDDDGGVRGMDAEDYGAAKKSWLRQEEGRFAEGARRDSVAGKTLKNIGKTVLDAAMSAVGKVVGPVGAAIGKSDRQIAGEAIERQKAQTTDMGALDAERAPFYQKHWKDLGFSEAPAEDLRGDDLTHWVTWQKFNQTQQRKRDAKISDGWEFERYETPKEGARWLEPEKYEDPATGETRWRGRETTVTSVGRMTFPDGKGGFGESEVVRDEKGRHVFMDADGVKRDADTLKVIGEPDGFWKDFGWRNPTVQTFMMKLARSPQAYAQYKERLLDEADMYLAKLESGEKIGAGEKGAEFASNIEDLLPLAGAAKEIGKQISIAQIATALSKDPESVSPMMKAWVMRELAKAERERVNGTTTAAAIEEGVAALIPFAAELGLGKAAIDKLTNLKTLAKGKLLDPNASALAKYLYSSAYGASVLGAQEIITAPRVVAGALERINRDYVSRIDDRGRLVLERSGEGQGVGEAWGNAFLDTLVENVSEMSGEAMGVVAKPFAQYLAKKKAGAALVRAIRAVEKATRPGSIAGAGRNEVIGGLVSEGMEERVGGFMRGFLGVDITDAEKAEGKTWLRRGAEQTLPASLDDALVETATLLAPAVLGAVGNGVRRSRQIREFRAEKERVWEGLRGAALAAGVEMPAAEGGDGGLPPRTPSMEEMVSRARKGDAAAVAWCQAAARKVEFSLQQAIDRCQAVIAEEGVDTSKMDEEALFGEVAKRFTDAERTQGDLYYVLSSAIGKGAENAPEGAAASPAPPAVTGETAEQRSERLLDPERNKAAVDDVAHGERSPGEVAADAPAQAAAAVVSAAAEHMGAVAEAARQISENGAPDAGTLQTAAESGRRAGMDATEVYTRLRSGGVSREDALPAVQSAFGEGMGLQALVPSLHQAVADHGGLRADIGAPDGLVANGGFAEVADGWDEMAERLQADGYEVADGEDMKAMLQAEADAERIDGQAEQERERQDAEEWINSDASAAVEFTTLREGMGISVRGTRFTVAGVDADGRTVRLATDGGEIFDIDVPDSGAVLIDAEAAEALQPQGVHVLGRKDEMTASSRGAKEMIAGIVARGFASDVEVLDTAEIADMIRRGELRGLKVSDAPAVGGMWKLGRLKVNRESPNGFIHDLFHEQTHATVDYIKRKHRGAWSRGVELMREIDDLMARGEDFDAWAKKQGLSKEQIELRRDFMALLKSAQGTEAYQRMALRDAEKRADEQGLTDVRREKTIARARAEFFYEEALANLVGKAGEDLLRKVQALRGRDSFADRVWQVVSEMWKAVGDFLGFGGMTTTQQLKMTFDDFVRGVLAETQVDTSALAAKRGTLPPKAADRAAAPAPAPAAASSVLPPKVAPAHQPPNSPALQLSKGGLSSRPNGEVATTGRIVPPPVSGGKKNIALPPKAGETSDGQVVESSNGQTVQPSDGQTDQRTNGPMDAPVALSRGGLPIGPWRASKTGSRAEFVAKRFAALGTTKEKATAAQRRKVAAEVAEKEAAARAAIDALTVGTVVTDDDGVRWRRGMRGWEQEQDNANGGKAFYLVKGAPRPALAERVAVPRKATGFAKGSLRSFLAMKGEGEEEQGRHAAFELSAIEEMGGLGAPSESDVWLKEFYDQIRDDKAMYRFFRGTGQNRVGTDVLLRGKIAENIMQGDESHTANGYDLDSPEYVQEFLDRALEQYKEWREWRERGAPSWEEMVADDMVYSEESRSDNADIEADEEAYRARKMAEEAARMERLQADIAAGRERGTGSGEQGTVSREPGMGNGEPGMGNGEPGMKFSIAQSEHDRWNAILDDYEAGRLKPNSHLTVLDRTPAVLARLGAPDLPVNLNKDILDKITGIVRTSMGSEHKIPVSGLRNLQIELDNPIAVFDSRSQQDAMVVLTRIIDRQNNERAVVALHLDKAQGAIRVNDIASAYGKDKQSIENWTAWGLLRYVNKQARKSSAKWFQLPSDSDLRAAHVLTEKDFTAEQLGKIVQDAPAEDKAKIAMPQKQGTASREEGTGSGEPSNGRTVQPSNGQLKLSIGRKADIGTDDFLGSLFHTGSGPASGGVDFGPQAPVAGDLFSWQGEAQAEEAAKPELGSKPLVPQKRESAGRVKMPAKAGAKIDDVGEKILGARKDLLKKVAASLSDATEKAFAEQPFSKVYKRPDLGKMVDAGVLRDDEAMFLAALLEMVNTQKPKKWYLISSWAKANAGLAKIAANFISGDEAARGATMRVARESQSGAVWRDIAEVMGLIGYDVHNPSKIPYHPVKPEGYSKYRLESSKGEQKHFFATREEAVAHAAYLARLARGDADLNHPESAFRVKGVGQALTEPTGKWYAYVKGDWKLFDTREEAAAKSQTIQEQKKHVGYSAYGVVFMDELSGAEYELDKTFPTREEANAYIASDAARAELDEMANAALEKARGEKGRGASVTADDMLRVFGSFEDGRWRYRVDFSPRFAKLSGGVLAKTFDSYREAEKYREAAKQTALEYHRKATEARRNFDYFKTGEGARAGRDWRGGADVDAERLRSEFGFRGIQFGNWTDQGDRQAAINEANDALKDLAALLGIPDRAISLGGELGLAFGARGSGSASAHYEPGETVINLTKTRGVGALAHEWWHALDNCLARAGGASKIGFATDGNGEGMREELRAAFRRLTDAVGRSDYAARSRAHGEYWGRMIEMTARLFADHIQAEMGALGARNVFLASPENLEKWQRVSYDLAKLAGQDVGSFEDFAKTPASHAGWPYPTPEEVAAFAPLVKAVFGEIRTRTDEATGNVMLYSIAPSAPRGRQKAAGAAYPDARDEISSIRFSIGAKRRAEYEKVLARHRPDIDAGKVLAEIGKFDDTRKEKIALHWVVRGGIRLPEDSYKIDDALSVADKAKVDPFRYKSPDELMLSHKEFRPSARPIDPATVPELSDARDEGGGVVTYEVADTREGQAAMRRIIDTHWGEDANPWCLLARDKRDPELSSDFWDWMRGVVGGRGEDAVTRARDRYFESPEEWETQYRRARKRDPRENPDELTGAWGYWNHYNAMPKRVAFKNGRLLAFMATDGIYEGGLIYGDELQERFPELVPDYEAWQETDEGRENQASFNEWMSVEHGDLYDEALKNPREQWWDRKDESHIDAEGLREIASSVKFSIALTHPWPADFPNVVVHTSRLAVMAKHRADFDAAKAGDVKAAERLVRAVVKPERIEAIVARHPGAIVVPVNAEEATGNNRIPIAYAKALAAAGLELGDGIAQSVRANHTGAGAMERLVRAAEFDGTVQAGREYVLVDDHVTQGGTLNELRNYIEDNGGRVVEISCLTASQGSTILPIRKDTLDALAAKFGEGLEDELRAANIAGRLDALTESQGRYLLKFSPSSLRGLLANEQGRAGEDTLRSETLPLDAGRDRGSAAGLQASRGADGLPGSVREEEAVGGPRGILPPRQGTKLSIAPAGGPTALPPKAGTQLEFDFNAVASDPVRRTRDYAKAKKLDEKRARGLHRELAAAKKFSDRTRELYRKLLAGEATGDEWGEALAAPESNRGEYPTVSRVISGLFTKPTDFPATALKGLKVATAEDVAALMMLVRSPYQETIKAVFLDKKGKVLDARIVAAGTIDRAPATVPNFLRDIPEGTTTFIMSHNHPSGDPSPSREDYALTQKFQTAARTLGLTMADHVVTDGDRYWSMAAGGMLDLPEGRRQPAEWEIGPSMQVRSSSDMAGIVAGLRQHGDVPAVVSFGTKMNVDSVRILPGGFFDGDPDVAKLSRAVFGSALDTQSGSVIVWLPETLSESRARKLSGRLAGIGANLGIRVVDVLSPDADDPAAVASCAAAGQLSDGAAPFANASFGAVGEGTPWKYSIAKSEHDRWNAILDDYEAGKIQPGDRKAILDRTPEVLKRCGASDLPIVIHGGILDKITGKTVAKSGELHKIPVSELRNLQIELDNPIAVFDSRTAADGMVVLTRLVDRQNNEKAVVALKLGARAEQHIVNAVASVHGRPDSQLQGWIDDGLLRYVNKQARKTSARWLQLPGERELRARRVLTEKDFTAEQLGMIVQDAPADGKGKIALPPKRGETELSVATVTREEDAAYMDAVNRGDMETAQRMVREAAERAMPETMVTDGSGEPKTVLHGTNAEFNVFDERKAGSANDPGWLGRGFYFYGNNPDYASQYGSRVISAYLNITNPYFATGDDMNRLAEANTAEASEEFRQQLIDEGYDGVSYDGDLNDEWVAFYPSQIKSADPVTYDDAGNVIPLSQRFNPQNEDIRYSIAPARDGKSKIAMPPKRGAANSQLANSGGVRYSLSPAEAMASAEAAKLMDEAMEIAGAFLADADRRNAVLKGQVSRAKSLLADERLRQDEVYRRIIGMPPPRQAGASASTPAERIRGAVEYGMRQGRKSAADEARGVVLDATGQTVTASSIGSIIRHGLTLKNKAEYARGRAAFRAADIPRMVTDALDDMQRRAMGADAAASKPGQDARLAHMRRLEGFLSQIDQIRLNVADAKDRAAAAIQELGRLIQMDPADIAATVKDNGEGPTAVLEALLDKTPRVIERRLTQYWRERMQSLFGGQDIEITRPDGTTFTTKSRGRLGNALAKLSTDTKPQARKLLEYVENRGRLALSWREMADICMNGIDVDGGHIDGALTLLAQSERDKKAIWQDRKTTREELSQRIADDIKAKHKPLKGSETEGVQKMPLGTKRGFFWWTGALKTRALWLAGGDTDSDTFRALYGMAKDANERQMAAEAEDTAAMEAKWAELGFTDERRLEMSNVVEPVTLTRADGTAQKVGLTRAEMMTVYAMTLDPDATLKLHANGFAASRFSGLLEDDDVRGSEIVRGEGESREDRMASMAAKVRQITSMLTEEEKEFCRWLTNEQAHVWARRGNEASRELLGYEIFDEDAPHFTLMGGVYRGASGGAASQDDFSNFFGKGGRPVFMESKGNVKERQAHSHLLLARDIFAVARQQNRDMSIISQWMGPYKDLVSMLNSGSPASSAIIRVAGRQGIADIRETLNQLTAQGEQQRRDVSDTFWSRLRSGAAVFTLGMRASSIAMNRFGGMCTLAGELSLNKTVPVSAIAEMWARLANPASMWRNSSAAREGAYAALMANPYLANRWGSHAWEVAGQFITGRLESEEAGAERDLRKARRDLRRRKFAQWALSGMTAAEVANGIDAYLSMTRAGIAPEEAVRLIADATRDTQNPSTPLEYTGEYNWTRGGGPASLLFMFQGQPTVQGDWVKRSLYSALQSKDWGAATRVVLTAITAAAITAAVRGAVRAMSSGGGGDDDKLRESMAKTFAEELGANATATVGGEAVNAVLSVADAVRTGKVSPNFGGGRSTPASQAIDGVFGAAEEVAAYASAESRGEDVPLYKYEKTLLKAFEVGGSLAGLPLGGVEQIVKVVSGLCGHPIGKKVKMPPKR